MKNYRIQLIEQPFCRSSEDLRSRFTPWFKRPRPPVCDAAANVTVSLVQLEPWKFEFHPIDDCSKYVTVSLFCPYYFAVHTRNKDKTKIWLCFDVNRCVGVLGCAWLCGTKTGDVSQGGGVEP